jgi:hypothetical protein
MGRSGRLAVSVVRINGRTCEENVAEVIWGITVFTTTDTKGQLAGVTRFMVFISLSVTECSYITKVAKNMISRHPFLRSLAGRLEVCLGFFNIR